MMIQSHHRPKHLMAFPANVPSSAVRHLDDQPAHMQPLQHPTHRRALATAFPGILGRSIQRRSDVGVAEPPHHVVTIQHGS